MEYAEQEYPHVALTEAIIAAAIAVHRALGPGFLEKIYENALLAELEARGHKVARQVSVDVIYRDKIVGNHRIDLLVDDEVVVEIKSVQVLIEEHVAQVRSTLKAAKKRIGLLMNFNHETLKEGLRRVIN